MGGFTIKENGGARKNILLLQGYSAAVRKELGTVALSKMEKVFQRSQELVPEKSGDLKRSGGVVPTGTGAKVVYTADYAARIEYDLTLKHPKGQAFFVGEPFQAEKQAIKEELARAATAPLKKKI